MTDNAQLYDPNARRDTPLARVLKDRIRATGPITVATYMTECLQHPEHGYYSTRQAIGREGDFITAPEISQIFGELIGLWSAVVWQQMGSPQSLHLVELGPGRGTLLADALRATQRVPGFHAALHLTLIESSKVLAAQQQAALSKYDLPIRWQSELSLYSDPTTPTILLANEFLDALPVAQHQRTSTGDVVPRQVGFDTTGNLIFIPSDSAHAEIITDADTTGLTATLLGPLKCAAALFIDYGHTETGHRDTLQAVRAHKPEHPLTSPGEADLTTHVDFAAFIAQVTKSTSFIPERVVTQAEFLGSLGIVERAQRLIAANPSEANLIETSASRLIAPQSMGTRFKAVGLRSPHLPSLPGFENIIRGRS